MACPDSVTIRKLDGHYSMNKEQSGDTDQVLQLQQISWLVRQAVKFSWVTLEIKTYTDDQKIDHIDITQRSTGGQSSEENRTLNWTFGEKEDRIFGKVRGRARFCKVEELEEDFLKQDWDPKSLERDDGEIINAYTESTGMRGDQWTANQAWGFQIINGVRKYVRNIVVRRGQKVIQVKTVYDYVPESK